jgi:hypothetical protein
MLVTYTAVNSRSRPHSSRLLVPHFKLAQILLRASGKVELKGKPKHAVYLVEEVETVTNLIL